jgi:hypothetical protein
MQAFAGRHKYKEKRFGVTYKQQFDTISPGYYMFYGLLCDMAHGAMASHILKITADNESKRIIPDDGIVFKPQQASFIINQYTIYLLGHLNFLVYIFPEIKDKMPEFYKVKLDRTLSWLNNTIEEFSKNEKNRIWLESAKGIINIKSKSEQ